MSAVPYDAIVTAAHVTQYSDPIRFKAGDQVTLGRRDEEYPGWIWTTIAGGNSGWAPEDLLSQSGSTAIALGEYDSTELATQAGERVRVISERFDWAWVRNSAGREGWVPLRTLRHAS